MKKEIKIAVGIIVNPAQSEVFITQRQQNSHCAGLWEFAGGKVEAGETPEQALVRELNEEVGIAVQAYRPLTTLPYEYGEKSLLLYFFIIEQFNGSPYGRENQVGKWVGWKDLSAHEFPKANAPVIAQLLQQFMQ